MRIEHIAIWTKDLDSLRNYYTAFFGGKSNQKYVNPKTQLESYFISFESGARLELMSIPNLVERQNVDSKRIGIIHIAFEVNSRNEVDLKAKELNEAGFTILKGPRITGDGYYEFETLDIEGNKIEVTAKKL